MWLDYTKKENQEIRFLFCSDLTFFSLLCFSFFMSINVIFSLRKEIQSFHILWSLSGNKSWVVLLSIFCCCSCCCCSCCCLFVTYLVRSLLLEFLFIRRPSLLYSFFFFLPVLSLPFLWTYSLFLFLSLFLCLSFLG